MFFHRAQGTADDHRNLWSGLASADPAHHLPFPWGQFGSFSFFRRTGRSGVPYEQPRQGDEHPVSRDPGEQVFPIAWRATA